VLIVEGHRFAITKAMVTNEQYRIFSETTGYKTLREREGIAQNWQYPNGSETPPSWREHPDRPVTWLARRDAEAYLCWLSLCHEQKVKFRLPSVQELAAALEEPEFWLWSHEDMGSLPSQRANAAEYLTSWRGNSPLRYRREEESLRSDHEATSFVIAWTLY
jgi:formylglycine-generating enzyme required for sulfatase activity